MPKQRSKSDVTYTYEICATGSDVAAYEGLLLRHIPSARGSLQAILAECISDASQSDNQGLLMQVCLNTHYGLHFLTLDTNNRNTMCIH